MRYCLINYALEDRVGFLLLRPDERSRLHFDPLKHAAVADDAPHLSFHLLVADHHRGLA